MHTELTYKSWYVWLLTEPNLARMCQKQTITNFFPRRSHECRSKTTVSVQADAKDEAYVAQAHSMTVVEEDARSEDVGEEEDIVSSEEDRIGTDIASEED